jgi:hypothetical protein
MEKTKVFDRTQLQGTSKNWADGGRTESYCWDND